MQTPSPVRSGSSVASAAAPRSVGCSCCRGTHPLSAPSCRTDDRHSGAVGSPPSSGCCLHNTCIACSAAVAVAAAVAAAHSAGCRRQELSGCVVHLLQQSIRMDFHLPGAASPYGPSFSACCQTASAMLVRPAAVVPSTRDGPVAACGHGSVLVVLFGASLGWWHGQQQQPPSFRVSPRPWGSEKA